MGLITRRPLTGDQAITQHQGSPANGPANHTLGREPRHRQISFRKGVTGRHRPWRDQQPGLAPGSQGPGRPHPQVESPCLLPCPGPRIPPEQRGRPAALNNPSLEAPSTLRAPCSAEDKQHSDHVPRKAAASPAPAPPGPSTLQGSAPPLPRKAPSRRAALLKDEGPTRAPRQRAGLAHSLAENQQWQRCILRDILAPLRKPTWPLTVPWGQALGASKALACGPFFLFGDEATGPPRAHPDSPAY